MKRYLKYIIKQVTSFCILHDQTKPLAVFNYIVKLYHVLMRRQFSQNSMLSTGLMKGWMLAEASLFMCEGVSTCQGLCSISLSPPLSLCQGLWLTIHLSLSLSLSWSCVCMWSEEGTHHTHGLRVGIAFVYHLDGGLLCLVHGVSGQEHPATSALPELPLQDELAHLKDQSLLILLGCCLDLKTQEMEMVMVSWESNKGRRILDAKNKRRGGWKGQTCLLSSLSWHLPNSSFFSLNEMEDEMHFLGKTADIFHTGSLLINKGALWREFEQKLFSTDCCCCFVSSCCYSDEEDERSMETNEELFDMDVQCGLSFLIDAPLGSFSIKMGAIQMLFLNQLIWFFSVCFLGYGFD